MSEALWSGWFCGVEESFINTLSNPRLSVSISGSRFFIDAPALRLKMDIVVCSPSKNPGPLPGVSRVF